MKKLDGRDDPCADLGDVLKTRLLKSVRDWAGQSWLKEADVAHPLKRLLARTDWLASAELLALGHAIQSAKQLPDGNRFLTDVRRHLHSRSLANWTGLAFELLSVSLVHCADHPVTLPPRGQPGYDLELNFANGSVIRTSCKALALSDAERRFRDFSAELFTRLAAGLQNGLSVEIQVWRRRRAPSKEDAIYNAAALADGLVPVAHKWAEGGEQPVAYGIGPWFVTMGEATAFRDAKYWEGRPSFGLLVHQPQPETEGLRIRNKISDGLDNLSKHCGDVRPGLTNALMVKVPTSTSMKSAVGFAEQALREHPAVSCVYLARSQLALLQDNETSALGHEFRVVPNPAATVHYRDVLPSDVRIRFRPFYGQFLGAEPTYQLQVGSETIPLDNSHAFYKADRTYWTTLRDDEREATAIYPRRFTESVSWAFTSPQGGTVVRKLFEAPDELPEIL